MAERDEVVTAGDFEIARYLTGLAGLVIGTVIMAVAIWSVWKADGAWQKAIDEHLLAILGFPLAVGTATTIVAAFRTTEGPIRVELLGLKFEGASGPILMWVICFGAIGAVLRMLW